MPVEKGPRLTARSALVVGLAGVIAALGLLVLVLVLADTGGVDVQLGDDVFEAGDTERIAAEIADRGPILYSDVAGGTRDIYLVHLGEDPATGWFAFAAQQPGAPRDCFVEWDEDGRVFVDGCDDTEFTAEGEGLPQYAVLLEDDGEKLVVDLNDIRSTTTSAPD